MWDNALKQIFSKHSWTEAIWPEVWGGKASGITTEQIVDGLAHRAGTYQGSDDLSVVLDERKSGDPDIDTTQFFEEVLQTLANEAAVRGWCQVFQPKFVRLSTELSLVPPSISLSKKEKAHIAQATGMSTSDKRLSDESLNSAYKIPEVQEEVRKTL